MRSLNKVTILGRIGKDIETNSLSNGGVASSFTVATDEGYMDKNSGQKVERTEWHRITAYGKTGEQIALYAGRGQRIYIEGKLRTREWEKDGIKRYTTEIIAHEFYVIDRKDNGQQTQHANQYAQQQPMQQYQQAPQQPMQQQQYQQTPQQYQQAPQQPMQQPQYQQAPQRYQQRANYR